MGWLIRWWKFDSGNMDPWIGRALSGLPSSILRLGHWGRCTYASIGWPKKLVHSAHFHPETLHACQVAYRYRCTREEASSHWRQCTLSLGVSLYFKTVTLHTSPVHKKKPSRQAIFFSSHLSRPLAFHAIAINIHSSQCKPRRKYSIPNVETNK